MPIRIADLPEEPYRELHVAVYEGDGARALAALADQVPESVLQLAGDGTLIAVAQRVDGAPELARAVSLALLERWNEGDEELADQLDTALGLAPAPMLRPLPVDLDVLSSALEGDPLLTGGRLDLGTGEVIHASPMLDSFLDAEDEDLQDPDRWLTIDSEGSRAGFEDMESFLDTIDDDPTVERLSRLLHGRGVFRRFKDGLADIGELERFHRFADDHARGRARSWLADRGLRPALPRRP